MPKFDQQLEELDLLQCELEEQRAHSQEQIERLKQQLSDLETDLAVKDRELRALKFSNILATSPAHRMTQNANNNTSKNNGSFIN